MSETTNPGGEAAAEVVTVPAEQDFRDFETSLTAEKPEEEAVDEATDFADTDTPEAEAPASEDDSDEDFEEIEHKGKKYKVPKGAALMQADYTRKTQEVAELRKRFEALTTQASEISEVERTAQAGAALIDQQLAQFDDIDWASWRQQDPIAAMQAQMDLQTLQQQKAELAGRYTAAQSRRLALAQQESATRLAEGQKVLVEKIPDWGPTKQREIVQHAMENYGLTAEDLAEIDDPRAVLIMHDAMQFATQRKKQQVTEKVVAQQQIKPVQTLKGNQGRQTPRADTNDFLAFEKLANAKIKRR